MKRRAFLTTSLSAAAASLVLRPLRAQPSAGNRAAVVIGVDKPGGLPKLKAAASGAKAVSSWLSSQGFEAKLLADITQPVKASDVFDTIAALVRRGTLDQLVVYFAGHGFIKDYSEYWLLSGAPDNPNEAISVNESIFLARQTAIPNVVIISDACRSKSEDLQTERVRGSLVFPNNRTPPPKPTDVDLFYATLIGDPSWEVSVHDSTTAFDGIFTATFLDAFKNPDDSMTTPIGGKLVVPNRKLQPFLLREVPRRAQQASIRITQRPDVQVVSGDSTYIGTVASTAHQAAVPSPAPASVVTLATAAFTHISSSHVNPQVVSSWLPLTLGPGAGSELMAVADSSGFTHSATKIVTARGTPVPSSVRTGFEVSGAPVGSIRATPGVTVKLSKQSADRALIDVSLGTRRAGSVAVRFADGSGCVLVALKDYLGSVVVDEAGVSNVSYLPIYMRDPNLEPRLTALHAAVATSARFGVFRIEGGRRNSEGAARLASQIRVMKGYDATLGIYAAYAYAQADIQEQVRSVRGYMHDDYGVDLFDLAMLAGELYGRQLEPTAFVPPLFPMLSQGWSLLRVKDARLPVAISKSIDHLKPSLWTTFDAEGMKIIDSGLPWS
jgi:hypothetical protein